MASATHSFCKVRHSYKENSIIYTAAQDIKIDLRYNPKQTYTFLSPLISTDFEGLNSA